MVGFVTPGCFIVAPLAGAWIETSGMNFFAYLRMSRPSRARGLKQATSALAISDMPSRPSRARGLKQLVIDYPCLTLQSRPSRARGLKLRVGIGIPG